MWINRLYNDKLTQIVKQRPVLVLTGARQTGKTSLLKHLFPSYTFISLDLPSDAEQAEKDPESFLKRFPAPLLIDEVQYAPGIFRHIKRWVDNNREPGQFILTGSQKFTLMKSLSESLAGRAEILELETLSHSEISSSLPPVAIENVLLRGGYPELWEKPDLNAASYYRSYVASYLERDLKQIINVSQLREFERFLRILALRSGQLLNQAEIAKDVGVSPTSIATWLAALIASNQVFLLEPWFSNRTKRMIKTPKIYLHDTGLMNFLAGIESIPEMLRSPLLGSIWETFIFSEIRKYQTKSRGGWRLNFWSDRVKEVDFVIDRGGNLSFYECKWSEHPDESSIKGMEYAEGRLKNLGIDEKMVISRSPNEFPISKTSQAIPYQNLKNIF